MADFSFLDAMEDAKTLRYEEAMEAVNKGDIDKYIGNPGIINGLNMTPLIALIEENATKEAVECLELGCNPNLPQYWIDGRKRTYPLEVACEKGDYVIVKTLLEKGADVSLCNLNLTLWSTISWYKWEMECRDEGKRENYLDCIKFLFDKGANPDYSPPKCKSSIESSKNNPEIIEIFSKNSP